jgi:uncharacterized protein (TIGR02246 family)
VDEEERAIGTAREAFAAALRAGDARAASCLYSEDARLLAPSAEPIKGRAAIEGYWQTGVEAGVSQVGLEVVELRLQERLAYEIGRYTLQLEGEDGSAVVDRGTYFLVHEQQDDGSWQWAVEMFNPDAPGGAVPHERGRS